MMRRYHIWTAFLVISMLSASLSLLLASPVSGAGEWNEGSILLAADSGDQVSPDGYPIKEADPGDDLIVYLWVNNDGPMEQTVIMGSFRPDGWRSAVTGSVQVAPGGSERITVAIEVPTDMMMDPKGDFFIRVEAVGNVTGDRAFTIIIIRLDAKVDHILLVSPYNTAKHTFQVYPGQRTYVELLLRNTGEMMDLYHVEMLEHMSGWDIQFRENREDLDVPLPFRSIDSVYMTRIEIGVPGTADIGQVVDLVVRSTSNLSSTFDVGRVMAEVTITLEVVPGATLTLVPYLGMISIMDEDPVEVDFRIVHTGVIDCIFQPSLEVRTETGAPVLWDHSFDLRGSSLITAGETRHAFLTLTPSKGASGIFTIVLMGSSEEAHVNPGQVVIKVERAPQIAIMDLEGGPFYPDEQVQVSFKVENSGDSAEHVLLLAQGMPTCYLPEMLPSNSFTLGRNEVKGVQLVMHRREGASPMGFTLTLIAQTYLEKAGAWVESANSTILIRILDVPDLAVKGIELPIRPFNEGETIRINVTVSNRGALDVSSFYLVLYEITWSLSRVEISRNTSNLQIGSEAVLRFTWKARPSAMAVRAVIVLPEGTGEANIEDNELLKHINVIPKESGGDVPGESGMDNGIPPGAAVAAMAGTALLAGIAIFLGTTDQLRYSFFTALAPLYSKLRPETLLSNKLRRRIYVYVQNNPGDHFRSILVKLNLTNGTLAHHLYTLEKENLIRSQRDGLFRRFYPAGYQVQEERVNLSALQIRILEKVKERPGMSQKDISQALGLSNSTVNYNVKTLKDKGLVEMQKSGKSTLIFPKNEASS